MIYSAFGRLADGIGLAEPCWGSPVFEAVVSGWNRARREPFVLQLFSGTAGGPATAESDGWLTFSIPAGGGLSYVDETEVIEQKYPFVVWETRVRPDSEGAGRHPRRPRQHRRLRPPGRRRPDRGVHYSLDGSFNVPKGVQGGGPALGPPPT